jgi:hypothetical protein
LVKRVLDVELHFTSAEEPTTFAATKRECWRVAMIEEMDLITNNATMELVDLRPGHRA